MKLAAVLLCAVSLLLAAQAPEVAPPMTTEVLVILTAKPGVSRQQILNVMPGEVRDTVKLYLDGKIREWYSKSDGKGVVFIVDAKTADDARAIMEALPLAKEHLMDYEYIPIGPLRPLAALIGASK